MKFGNKGTEGFSVSKVVYFIIGVSIALLVLSSLLPTVIENLEKGEYTNPAVVVMVGLIGIVFVAAILMYLLRFAK